MRLTDVLCLVAVALAVAGCDGAGDNGRVRHTDVRATASFSMEEAVGMTDRLVLRAVNGVVEITGDATIDRVIVEGERIVGSESRDDAEAHLADLDVRIARDGTALVVRTEQPSADDGRLYAVNYQIHVPAGYAIDVELANGDLDVTNVRGEIVVDLINGNSVFTLLEPVSAPIGVTMVNGNLMLRIPANTSADFSATVVNGLIQLDNLTLVGAGGTSRAMSGQFGAGGADITLSVVNGLIVVSGGRS